MNADGTFSKNDSRINKKGRPKKGESLTEFLNWALDQKKTIKVKGEEKIVLLRQILAERLIEFALKGNVQAMKYVYDRIDGKPKESVDIGGGLQLIKITDTDEKALE